MSLISKTGFYLQNSPLLLRRSLLLIFDLLIVYLSIYLTSFLYLNLNYGVFENFNIFVYIIVPALIYLFLGQYKGILKYRGNLFFYGLAFRNLLIITIYYFFSNLKEFLNKEFLLVFLLITFFQSGLRLLAKDFLFNFISLNLQKKIRIVIYGAGEAGAQLAASLSITGKYKLFAFIDDDKQKNRRSILGIPIKNRHFLMNNTKNIDQVFLAIPSLDSVRRKDLLSFLSKLNLSVLQIPSFDDIISGKEKIYNLKPVTIDDLLGRDSVIPNIKLLEKTISNKNILITGGGGSIGSEICRQAVKLRPKNLVLLDNSEINLYNIKSEINSLNIANLRFSPLLGNCLDKNFLYYIFEKYNINTVIHAAAYKHVPIVEENPINGIFNNVFSTKNLCEISENFKIKNFLLISSDKAVRPTNYMGASKRLSELIVQAFSQKIMENTKDKSQNTIFTMVRFGNVLGSSGSVVPLFVKQLSEGGPITITHPQVTRYFMTIPEAAQLVLQASALAKGGETFLLDMGEPILIEELAKQMIYLSGKRLVDKKQGINDIEIKYTGLRKGEKIYEELLISGKSEKTKHPLIFSSKEKFIDFYELLPKLDLLEKYSNQKDIKEFNKVISDLVPEWIHKKS